MAVNPEPSAAEEAVTPGTTLAASREAAPFVLANSHVANSVVAPELELLELLEDEELLLDELELDVELPEVELLELDELELEELLELAPFSTIMLSIIVLPA